MGRKERERPEKLAPKLLAIRNHLGLSQTQMWKKLGLEEKAEYKIISRYETGKQEPALLILLRYAESVGISTDTLIDDRRELPNKLVK